MSLKIKALTGKSKLLTRWWEIAGYVLAAVLCFIVFSAMFYSFCPSRGLNSIFLYVHITFNSRPYHLIITLPQKYSGNFRNISLQKDMWPFILLEENLTVYIQGLKNVSAFEPEIHLGIHLKKIIKDVCKYVYVRLITAVTSLNPLNSWPL